MERLTQNNFDYCLEMCEPECMQKCPFYKDDRESKCHTAAMYDKLSAYEDTGLEPEEIRRSDEMLKTFIEFNRSHDNPRTLDWLLEKVTAECDGRLVVLPCKVGDTVWEIGYDCKIDYEDMCSFPAPSCDECEFVKRVIVPVRVDSVTAATFLVGKIGTTAFFSFEDAEAALKGVSEDG